MTLPARYRVASSYPVGIPANPAVLDREYFGGRVPVNETYRPHFGRSLDLDRIDQAIRAANNGRMSIMTDLALETIALDGHVSALLQKRLNRVGALDWDVQPATGPEVDEGLARELAAEVRENIAMMPNFRDRLTDIAWGNFHGRATSEIEWARQGRAWRVRDLHWIHPRRLSFGPDRDIRVIDPMRQVGNFQDMGFAVEAVPYKFLVFRPRMFGDYQEREGLAPRTLYWSFFSRLGTRERLELMEIFGKPWRILIPKTGPGLPAINVDALTQGFDALTLLGYHNTARMPANVEVQVVQPEQGAGQVHKDVVEDCRNVLTKMYLGGVATTEAISTGLGSSIGNVQLSEEDLIIASDARRIAEAVEDQLTDAMVIVNHGPAMASHAPKFVIRTDAPVDRKAEAERIGLALNLGMRVAEEEARDRIGIREVRVDEPYLVRFQRRTPLGQVPPPIASELVYPVGLAPVSGEVPDVPETVVTIPEEPEPLALPPGGAVPALPAADGLPGAEEDAAAQSGTLAADDPDLDGVDDVAAFAAKMTELGIERCPHGKPNRCRVCGIERKRDVELDAGGQPVWSVAWKPIGAPARAAAPPPAAPADGSLPLGTSESDGTACEDCGAEPGTNIDCPRCMGESPAPDETTEPERADVT